MKDRDIEKYLSHFMIKGPKDDLRHKVLVVAESAWTSSKVFCFRFNLSRFARAYACTLGLALLVSVVSSKIDSRLMNNLLNGETATVKHIEETIDMERLHAEVGFGYKTGRLLLAILLKE